MRSASDTFVPPLADLLNAALDPLEHLQHLRQLRRLVHFPVLLRREPDARAIGAAALVAAAESGSRSQAVDTSWETLSFEARISALRFAMSVSPICL